MRKAPAGQLLLQGSDFHWALGQYFLTPPTSPGGDKGFLLVVALRCSNFPHVVP